MTSVVVLGAYGTMGQLIAREAGRKNLELVLAGRRADRLMEVASEFSPGQARAAVLDVSDVASLERVFAQADIVLNTIGPFATFANPVIAACLRAGTHYVDLANELAAVSALLERDAEARQRGIVLVTGAGFGVVATETLALQLARDTDEPLQSVEVAAAQAVAFASTGVQATIAAAIAQGGPRYVDGQLVVDRFGEGATVLRFPDGRERRAVPAPLGDLIAAQRATGAPNVIAYAPLPEERSVDAPAANQMRSVAMAEASTVDGQRLRAELSFGEGFAASAAIAVEVAVRLVSEPRPGSWTPGQLFGVELAAACGALTMAA